MRKLIAAFAVLGVALANPARRAEAGEWRWVRYSHMGGPFAGIVAAEGGQMTLGCAGEIAPSWQRGPYLLGVLPAPQRAERPPVLEIHIDSRAVHVPIELVQEDGALFFLWKPNQRFDLSKMRALTADLRVARKIELRVADVSADLPVEGAVEALADDPLQCP